MSRGMGVEAFLSQEPFPLPGMSSYPLSISWGQPDRDRLEMSERAWRWVWLMGAGPLTATQSKGRGPWGRVLSHALSPLLVQFFQQADGGPAQLSEAVLGWSRAMHWASLWSPGGRLWAQGRSMELEVVQATDVSLKS